MNNQGCSLPSLSGISSSDEHDLLLQTTHLLGKAADLAAQTI